MGFWSDLFRSRKHLGSGMAGFAGAVLYGDRQPPADLIEFACQVFRMYNAQAAQMMATNDCRSTSTIEAVVLGASPGSTFDTFLKKVTELAQEEAANRFKNCTLVIQPNKIGVQGFGTCHTALCSYFQSEKPTLIALQPKSSLDRLLQ